MQQRLDPEAGAGDVKSVAIGWRLGDDFLGDAVATVVAGSVGGSGTTTYAENIGVMAATRIYSTAMFVVAGAMLVARRDVT